MTSSPRPGGVVVQPVRPAGDISIATAGHVDHGKSSLIQALTGTNPDRLAEERRREMTIELGFASMPRPGGGTLALIDVPGHDRLVETMIGGAGGIDAAVLAVAADDGPMPQTVEHLRILQLLGIERVIVALTKIDLVDADWLALAVETTGAVLLAHDYAEAAIVPVSARTGAGLATLLTQLTAIEPTHRRAIPDEAAWLPIDRAFLLGGHGTVVAGTLIRGRLAWGERIILAPSRLRATIRQIQSHGIAVPAAVAGQRVAVNLGGVSLDGIRRGNVLSDRPVERTTIVDIHVQPLDRTATPLHSGDRIRVLFGTDRLDATIDLHPQSERSSATVVLARLRFSRPVAIAAGDRVIIRRPSPAATIAGGIVLARYADRPVRVDPTRLADLSALARGDIRPTLTRRLAAGPVTVDRAMSDLPPGATDVLREALRDGSVRRVGPGNDSAYDLESTATVMAETAWRHFVDRLGEELASFHAESPEGEGLPLSALRARFLDATERFDQLLALAVRQGYIVRSGSRVSLRGNRPRIAGRDREQTERLLDRLASLPLGQSMIPPSQVGGDARVSGTIGLDRPAARPSCRRRRPVRCIRHMGDGDNEGAGRAGTRNRPRSAEDRPRSGPAASRTARRARTDAP